jgi:hypothetical protein
MMTRRQSNPHFVTAVGLPGNQGCGGCQAKIFFLLPP